MCGIIMYACVENQNKHVPHSSVEKKQRLPDNYYLQRYALEGGVESDSCVAMGDELVVAWASLIYGPRALRHNCANVLFVALRPRQQLIHVYNEECHILSDSKWRLRLDKGTCSACISFTLTLKGCI